MSAEKTVAVVSVILGLSLWFADAAVDYFVFSQGQFGGRVFFDVSSHHIFMRTVIVMLFSTSGLVLSRFMHKRRRVEEALRKSERSRMEAERLAARGQIAARVAHEINNPLAGIKGCFYLVKNAVPEGHPDLKFAELAEKEIDRIDQIVARMYELHRPDRETARDIDVEQLIDEVVVMVGLYARQNDVRVENTTNRPGTIARIPEGSLRQVLYNLLVNAVDASSPDGTVEIDATMADNSLQITVADQGSGVPPDVGHRIFEPFFSTKSHETTGGLGLGLSISRGIVEALNGSLDFESRPGEGTVFRVVLPSQKS